jgi:hypothetical protein
MRITNVGGGWTDPKTIEEGGKLYRGTEYGFIRALLALCVSPALPPGLPVPILFAEAGLAIHI